MNCKVGYLLAALLLLRPWCNAEQLTLEAAVDQAIKANRGLLNLRVEPAKIADQIAALRTRRFPAMNLFVLGSRLLNPLDFTFAQGLLGVYPGTGPIPATDVTVRTPAMFTGFLVGRVVQPVSPLYRIRQNVRLLEITGKLADEQIRQQQQILVRTVKQVYFGIQQADSALTAAQQMLALYREVERLTGEYAAQQVVLKGDHLAVQLQLAKAEQTELALRMQAAKQKETLNHLMARNLLTEFTVSPVADAAATEFPAAETAAAALANKPEVRQAYLRSDLAQQDIRAKRAEYIPDINLELNSLNLLNYNRFIPSTVNSVGISLTWDVFDWGRKKYELSEKRRIAEQARTAIAETEAASLLEQNDKLRELQLSRMQLRVARLANEAALENLRVTKDRFAAEASLMKDVLQSQASMQQALSEYQQAILKFWSAKADLDRANGEDR